MARVQIDTRPIFFGLSLLALALAGCTTPPAPAAPSPEQSSDVMGPSDPASPTASAAAYPRYTGTWDEWLQEYITCLREEGWDAEPGDPNDGVSISLGHVEESQLEALSASQERCNTVVGRIPDIPLTDEALTRLYGQLIEQYDCLVAAGYSAEPPPTVEVFIDRQRQGVATWDPMLGVPGPEYTEALAACPRSDPPA